MATTQQFYLPEFLTNVALMDAPKNFLAAKIFPPMTVNTQTGVLAEIDKARELLRIIDLSGAPGSTPPLINVEVTKDQTYFAKKYHVARAIPDEFREAATTETAPALLDAPYLVEVLLNHRENQLVAALAAAFTGGSYTATPSNKWNVAAGTPIADIQAKIALIEGRTGVSPNALTIDITVLRGIFATTEVQNKINYSTPIGQQPGGEEAMARALATWIGIDNVFVAKNLVKNTALPNVTTPTLSAIWSDYAFLSRVDTPRIGWTGTGMHVNWNGTTVGGIKDGFRVEQIRDGLASSDVTKASGFWAQLIGYKDTGFLFSDVL